MDNRVLDSKLDNIQGILEECYQQIKVDGKLVSEGTVHINRYEGYIVNGEDYVVTKTIEHKLVAINKRKL
jgi:hypothetical protein